MVTAVLLLVLGRIQMIQCRVSLLRLPGEGRDPYVDGPGLQGRCSCDGLVDCGHMSGPPLSRGQAFVVRSARPLAQMGYADRVPNISVMSKHHWVPRVVPILGSTDCHLAAAVLASARSRWWAGSGLLRMPVGLAADHHGPDDAGHLVGQRDRRELLWLAPQQSQDPRRGAARFGLPDTRGGAQAGQPPQVLIALPADLAGPVSACSRVLARGEADPGGYEPTR